jgi:formamidopyrimidine-DNA glycosylase
MPEGLEAEIWRTDLESLVGRTVESVWTDERVADPGIDEALRARRIERVIRVGKVVVVETDEARLGLHFGMTGRVIVDGHAAIDRLEYASGDDRPEWDRLRLWTRGAARQARQAKNSPATPSATQPAIRMNDPRRLGRLSLDPDLSHLGVDMFAVNGAALTTVFARRSGAIKSVLLDQSAIAGLGNLCADEVLWWSDIAPSRPASSLGSDDVAAMVTAIRRRLPIMLRRGGSTTGTLTPAVRAASGPCPRDGSPLRRDKIGGRTTVWCPAHQR